MRHGGALDQVRERFPDAPQPWIDLSTGINPWPYPHTEQAPEQLAQLPQPAAVTACRDAMAEAFGAPAERVLPAPGSELLIRLLPTILKPRSVAVLSPSYGDHREVWRSAGVPVMECANPLDPPAGADMVVLCNPNNPDGRSFDPSDLDTLRANLARRRGWLLVDEAFAELQPELSCASLAGSEGLIVLRSFGKFYGLAGLRLAALLAPAAIGRAMAERLGFWAVAGPALAIGARAYRDRDWQIETRQRLHRAARAMDALLLDAGIESVAGTALFRYLQVSDAHALWAHLASRGIHSRCFDWSRTGLRIGLPPGEAALRRLALALAEAR